MSYKDVPQFSPTSYLALTKTAGAVRNLYVSPNGDDGTGTGSLSRPFRTVAAAQANARVTYTGQPVVNVMAGTYYNTALQLDVRDTGSAAIPVLYKSIDGPGQARLVGGSPVTGWTLYSGQIYRVPMPAPVWTLFEDGVRARLARSPKLNPGASFPSAFAPYFTAAGDEGSYTTLTHSLSDFNPATWNLSDIRLFAWAAISSHQTAWFTDIHGVSSLNTTTHQFALNEGMKFTSMSGGAGCRYFVEGPLELLTEAGEFTCTGGYLYYWPRNPIGQVTIVAPTTKRVISIAGSSTANRCSYITFDGFSIECSDFDSWYRYGTDGNGLVEYDYFDTLQRFRQGSVYTENADHVTITNCHIKNAGFSGVFMQGYNQTNTVSNCWIEHTGCGGIDVNGMPSGQGNLSTGHTLTDNRIANIGELDGAGNGIRLSQCSSSTISFSDISYSPRRGIWLHGDFNVAAANNYCFSNSIDHVKVTHVCQDSGDLGAVTMSFLSAPSGSPSPNPVNTISQVIIDGARAHSSMTDAAPDGLFFDNQSSGQTASNVQISDFQGTAQRYNDSDGATFTNVSWLGGFNPALMDTANIGVTASFPY